MSKVRLDPDDNVVTLLRIVSAQLTEAALLAAEEDTEPLSTILWQTNKCLFRALVLLGAIDAPR